MWGKPKVNDPGSLASRFRKRRFQIVADILQTIIKKKGRATVLDVGGRRDYWDLADPNLFQNMSITLLNFEAELAVGKRQSDALDITYRQGNGCNMPEFPDDSFDLVHSNSVIEHVGSLHNMSLFADEVSRVGEAYYVQTPYLWFPIEPHFGVPVLHWLPAPTRALLHHRFNMGYSKRQPDYRKALAYIDQIDLLDKPLMRNLFPDGTLHQERVFFFTKSLIAVRNPLSKSG